MKHEICLVKSVNPKPWIGVCERKGSGGHTAARQRCGARGAGHHRGLLKRSENLWIVPVDVALSSFLPRHLVKK